MTNEEIKSEPTEPPDPYRTVWTLFKSPGVISYEINHGNTTRFVDPKQLFLFFWAAFFILAPGNRITPDLYGQMNNLPYSFVAKQVVEKKIKEQKMTLKVFEETYNDTVKIVAQAALYVMIFLFTFPLLIINRSKKLSFSDHITVSYEFITTLMICWYVVLSWLPGNISTYLLIVVLSILLYAFQRNAYKQTVSRAISKAALLVVSFFGVVVIYRAVIFFFTVWKS